MLKHFIGTLAFFILFQSFLAANGPFLDKNLPPAALSYLDRFAPLAVREMHLNGIPASITLAQALVETGNGLSKMAIEDLNHFGIKCHKTWAGDTALYRDDDYRDGKLIESCFRKYPSVEASYADRSAYLKNSKRYAALFALAPDDYRGWAHGLKAAGYATSATYAEDLIRKIEQLELWRFDQKSESEMSQFFVSKPVEREKREPKKAEKWAEKMAETDASPAPTAEKLGFRLPPPPAPNGSPSIVSRRPIFASVAIR